MVHSIFGTYLHNIYLLFLYQISCNWTPCIFPGKLGWSLSRPGDWKGFQFWGGGGGVERKGQLPPKAL